MSSYDRIIPCTTLDSKLIQQINNIKMQNPNQRILIEIPNTRGISSELIKTLNSRVSIRIAGGYDKERVARLGKVRYANGETGQYYTDAVIYSRNEAIRIIAEMEKIEKYFEGQNLSQFEKLVYIYGKLKAGIMYDPKFESKPSSEVRSLRGLLIKCTVCAGYAMIFKEMLDRQGIECHYVSGNTRSGGGHAWNIVSIDGKNYPIDLTWDNAKFRSGKFATYDFLGQNVDEFKRKHIPGDDEPCKYYKLSEMDLEEIRKASKRMAREKDYQSTTYEGTRKDGSKYIIAQVGDNKINGKKYFRYYYAEVLENGKLSNQTVVYSKTNVAHFINETQFGRPVPDGYEETIDNVLFSKENIRDSLSKGTFYIGSVRKTRTDNKLELVTKVSEITKTDEEQKLFRYPTKEFTRDDGSSFVVQQMSKGRNANGIAVNVYHIFEVVNENNNRIVKRNIVFSERDFLKDNRREIANGYLSRDELDRNVREAGGYIGYLDENGVRRYNPNLVKYFKSSESVKNKQGVKEQETKQANNEQNARGLSQEQLKRKIKWVRDFIKDYEDTEKSTSFALRENCEEQNIQTVLQSIISNTFNGNYDNSADKFGLNLDRVIPAMARLLKAADNITIDEGEDYLEKITNIPEVNQILLQIKRSEYFKQMHSEAENNRTNYSLPQFKRTRAESDKYWAQIYLRSGNLSRSSVKEEINYRKRQLLSDKLKVSSEVDKKNIPLEKKQQISLVRLLARQAGKVPSKLYYDKKIGWYFMTDTKPKVQPNVATEVAPESSSIDAEYISPSNIQNSIFRVKTTTRELEEVDSKIKGNQIRDLQQIQ